MEKYGAWGEKKLYGKVVTGVIRSTFVISPAGKIELALLQREGNRARGEAHSRPEPVAAETCSQRRKISAVRRWLQVSTHASGIMGARGSGGTADTLVLGTSAFGRAGSTPAFRTHRSPQDFDDLRGLARDDHSRRAQEHPAPRRIGLEVDLCLAVLLRIELTGDHWIRRVEVVPTEGQVREPL
jgi:hypothetical protein